MKVLLINGSPNEHGCTYTALCEAAGALNESEIETEIFHIGTAADSMPERARQLAARLEEFDGFIFGSPVYYASPSGTMLEFLDCLFGAGAAKMRFKPGAAVTSARRAGTTATLDVLNKYFTINCMPVVSSRYWNMVHGNTPDEVKQDAEGLMIMRTLGRNMAWMLKCIGIGKAAGVLPPEPEAPVRTNFIR